MKRRGMNRKGQVTIFIILAIILVVGAIVFFVFKDAIVPGTISSTFEPLESDFLNCIELQTLNGIQILETQGGYIESEFVAGSAYMPFSSELNFVGTNIPYWHFVSGNNIQIEQVPTKDFLQSELKNFLEKEIQKCSFEDYLDQGYSVQKGIPTAEVLIEDNFVRVSLNMDISMQKDIENVVLEDHEVEVNSNLGLLYDEAILFYNQEKEEMFLENYSVDILRLYAPVDGVELTCSPKVWKANEIFEDLRDATEINFLSLKNGGDEEDYFNLKLGIDSDVRIINSKSWPNVYEVDPADSPILISEPIGNQAGLGILGFCYVPYHFVYNVRYPVLIQLIQGEEVFQFPLAMVIEGNVPRKSLAKTTVLPYAVDICGDKLSLVTINLFDSDLNALNANVSYECFGSTCVIGETENGELNNSFPQCVNGKVVVDKEGYKKSSTTFSSVNGGSLSVILDREYEKQIVLSADGKVLNERAIVSFTSDESTETIIYPEQTKIKLSPGSYEIKIYVYDNSSLTFPETTREQCYDVPVSGIGGVFGFTTQECTEIKLPEQKLSSVLVGGGSSEYFFEEINLNQDNLLELKLSSLNVPSSLEELQINYALFEVRKVGVEFK